jgi:hypothetical protein
MKYNLTLPELRALMTAEINTVIGHHIAKARADGADEIEIGRYLAEARIETAQQVEEIMPVLICWLRGTTLVKESSQLQ